MLEPFRHKVDLLATCLQKSHTQFGKLIEYPSGNNSRVAHQDWQKKGVYRRGIDVGKHVAQRRAGPTDVNRQSNILSSDGLVEGQQARMNEHLIAGGAEHNHGGSAELPGLTDFLGCGRYVVQIRNCGPLDALMFAEAVSQESVVRGAKGIHQSDIRG